MEAPTGLYDLERVRSPQQRALYEDLTRKGICMFCRDGHEIAGVPVIKTGTYWTLARNRYPYSGAQGHYMCLYNDHVTSSDAVDPASWNELMQLFREQSLEDFGHTNFSVAMRHGAMAHTCSTVAHLHVHCLIGIPGKAGDKTIDMSLGYTG